MDQRPNIEFCFKTGERATESFQLIKQAYGDNALPRTRVFGAAVKISKMTNAVEEQQPVEHPTCSKQFVN
jgi:hypothetical protein